jgi:hypothetical protein
MKKYKCEHYKVMAHERSCFFCRKCTDIWWDYANGPYMFFCTDGKDIETGLIGECEGFEGEE